MAINYNFLKFQKTTYSDFICCLFVYVYHVVFPCSLHFSYLRHYVSIATWDLRAKIEAIITKPGVADEDCPTDAASMRWWCNVGGRYTGRELTSVAMNATANVAASGSAVASLVGGDSSSGGSPGGSSLLALKDGPSSSAPDPGAASGSGTPSLQTLVGLMSNQVANAKSKAKAKPKAKAKANPSQQTPMTPAEEREKFRTWVSFSFYWYLRLL